MVSKWEILELIYRYGYQTKEGKALPKVEIFRTFYNEKDRGGSIRKTLLRLKSYSKIKFDGEFIILKQSYINSIQKYGHKSFLDFFKLDRPPLI